MRCLRLPCKVVSQLYKRISLDGVRLPYIVANNLSVDCDCGSLPEDPMMEYIGILASLDPVALQESHCLVRGFGCRTGLHSCIGRSGKILMDGHCMYCGHCIPCSVGIDMTTVNKFYNLTVAQGEIPETVREHNKALAHHASECIACGGGETRCLFGVQIIDSMELAAKRFGC